MSEIRIEPINDEKDFPICAQLCSDAIAPDPFSFFLEQYGDQSLYESTLNRLRDAASPDNSTDFAFKAVIDEVDGSGQTTEKIVGVSHWYIGYIVLPKVDPFEMKFVSQAQETGTTDLALEDGNDNPPVPSSVTSNTLKHRRRALMADHRRQVGNLYISNVRGKKHVCKLPLQCQALWFELIQVDCRRMMVDPNYQRRGIGRLLLKWGLDYADEHKLVAWLNARPAGSKMYLDAGFKIVGTIDVIMAEGDQHIEIPPAASMLRVPQPWSRTKV
jgi:GNAT superfamily N-acetyltransferase